MGKTRVVIRTAGSKSPEVATSDGKKVSTLNLGSDEPVSLDWMHYAQLLRKELISKNSMGATKSIRKKSDKPASPAQLKSRANFKEKVAEAHLKYKDGTAGKKWKDCMSEVYREAKEKHAHSASHAIAETHKINSVIVGK
jgi:hypothetical protein